MQVEIWHSNGGTHKIATIEVSSVTDEATCELAYMLTQDGSQTQLRDGAVAPVDGDIFVLVDDDGYYRSYVLSLSDALQPEFTPIQFSR